MARLAPKSQTGPIEREEPAISNEVADGAVADKARAVAQRLGQGSLFDSRGTGPESQGTAVWNRGSAENLFAKSNAPPPPSQTPRSQTPGSVAPASAVDAVCMNSAEQPTLFLVDRFLNAEPAISEPGGFSDYPPVVRREFRETFQASLRLLQLKSKNTAPAATITSPLFKVSEVRSVNDLPTFLRAGDIVLAFAHLPPYVVALDGEFEGRLRLNGLDVEAGILFNRFWKAIDTHWRRVAASPLPPPISKGQSDNDVVGRSSNIQDTVTLTLKKGGMQNVYYSIRIGVVDVGVAAGEALQVYQPDTERNEKRAKLKILRQTRPEFGPSAVFAVKRGKYFESVGRLLAYSLLHELWHSGVLTQGHPYGLSPNIIEGSLPTPDVVPLKTRLTLQPKARAAILNAYENNWCNFIMQNTKAIGDIS